MRMVVRKPYNAPEEHHVVGDIGDWIRGQIGGWLEVLPPNAPVILAECAKAGIHVYGNEDAKGLRLEPNFPLIDPQTAEIFDWVAGPVVFCALTSDGDEAPLNDVQVDLITRLFEEEKTIAF